MRPWRCGSAARLRPRPGVAARALRLPAAALAVVLVTAGCAQAPASSRSAGTGSASTDPIAVVASTNVWGDIAAQIGGSRVEVTSLIHDPSQDPHTFQPSGRDDLAVSRAALVIENGGGYDDVMTTLIQAVPSDPIVVTAVQVARAADAQLTDNEHVWYDLPAVSAVAQRLADAFARLDPAGRAEFDANLARFRAHLTPVQRDLERIRQQHAGEPVAITEPLPVYLIEAAGLDNVTPEEFSEAVEEGIDVPPLQLADTLALFTEHRVRALVYNEQSIGAQTEQVLHAAQDNRIPVVPVTELLPAGQHYQGWMRDTVDALDAALSDADQR